MLVIILGASAGGCAVGWFCSRLSLMAMLLFMDEKGYTFPTDAEMKECCRKTTERMFRLWPTWKGKR